jgi:hypothetical protein
MPVLNRCVAYPLQGIEAACVDVHVRPVPDAYRKEIRPQRSQALGSRESTMSAGDDVYRANASVPNRQGGVIAHIRSQHV